MARSSAITRTIYVYELYALVFSNENNTYRKDFACINRYFDRLYQKQGENDSNKEYIVKNGNDESLIVLIDAIDSDIIKYRLVLCRKNALPYIERAGKLEKLEDLLKPDQNIAEVTHCIFYRKHGLLGAEYNHTGARPATIRHYIGKTDSGIEVVHCVPKINHEAYKELITGKEYSLFDLQVKSNSDAYNEVLAGKSIFSSIRSVAPDSDTFRVVIKQRKTKKGHHRGFELPLSDDEVKTLVTNYKDDLKTFQVSQGNSKDMVDLLSDKLLHKTSVPLVSAMGRTIQSSEMYDKIDSFICNFVLPSFEI